MKPVELIIRDLEHGARIASLFSDLLAHNLPWVLVLSGDLGTGKTTFVRALLRQMGYQDSVKSPSYGLMELYPLDKFNLYHWDLYRLSANHTDWQTLGFDETLTDDSIHCIEWGERFKQVLNYADLRLILEAREHPDERLMRLVFESPKAQAVFSNVDWLNV